MATTAERFANATPAGATTEALKKTFLEKNVLFYIERSLNSNAVIYEACEEAGALKKDAPVSVYWILYARDPVKEEGLNMIERNTAYGSKCVLDESTGRFNLSLSAIPDRKISVYRDDKGLHATTKIGDGEYELVHIYVSSTTSWGRPKVEYIELFGRKEDGSEIKEKING